MNEDELELELLEAFPGAEVVDELAIDAERLVARERTLELLDELDVGSTVVRAQMLADPERAVLVLESTLRATNLRNPAAFAVQRWRSGFDPRRARQAPVERVELEEGAPTLSAIEYAWSLEPVSRPILAMMSSAIGRTGGFRPVLVAGFDVRESFDDALE